jgi:hypothetical protein
MVRNGASVLPRLVNSLRGVADEICYVDTGSTDGTFDLVRSLSAATQISCSGVAFSPLTRPDLFFYDDPSSWRRPVPSPFTGLAILRDWSEARNHGLDLCRGEYVMKMDSDDELLTPDRVSSVLDGLDQAAGRDVLMCPYEVMDPTTLGKRWTEMYTRIWRRRPEIRFREVCHENVDWYRQADGSNWLMVGNALVVRDYRDSRGQGLRIAHRNYKVLLREYERLESSGQPPTAHLVMYLAQEGVEADPVFAISIVEKWLSRLTMHQHDEAWKHFVLGECREAVGDAEQAHLEYSASARLGFHRARLRRAMLEARTTQLTGWRERLSQAIGDNLGHFYPRGASAAEVERARRMLED